MEPKNKTRRNVDCRTEDFFPEVCYPKNDPFWSRLTVCDDQGDPCDLDLSGLRKPDATVQPSDEGNPGALVGNQAVTKTCPSPYVDSATLEGSGTPLSVEVPANQFERFVEDARDTAAIAEAQTFVDNLANIFAQSQLLCFAGNTEQTENCPSTHTVNGGTNNLINGPVAATVPANDLKRKMPAVRMFLNAEDRLDKALSEDDIGSFVVQVDIPEPHYFPIETDGAGGAQYGTPVYASSAYSTLHTNDTGELDAAAQDKAFALLECEYGNTSSVVNCPPDPDGEPARTDQGVASVTVAANTLTYRILNLKDGAPYPTLPDQSAVVGGLTLDEQARRATLPQLRCVWWNEFVSLVCPSVGSSTPTCDVDECPTQTNDAQAGLFSDYTAAPITFYDRSPGESGFKVNITTDSVGGSPISPSSTSVGAGAFLTNVTFTDEDNPDALSFPAGEASVASLTTQAQGLAASQILCRYGNAAYTAEAECCPDDSSIPVITEENVPLDECKVDSITPEDFTVYPDSSPVIVKNQAPVAPTLIRTRIVAEDAPAGGWPPAESSGSALSIDEGEIILAASGLPTPSEAQSIKNTADQLAYDTMCSAFRVCLWGNEEIAPAHCEPENSTEAGQKQLYNQDSSGDTLPANMVVSPEGKFQAQVIAVTVALASRVCQPRLAGNTPVSLFCPDAPSGEVYGVFLEEGSVKPVIPADTFFADTECLATELALDIALAQRVCAYGNKATTSRPCPDHTEAQHDPMTLDQGTIVAYLPDSTPTATAQLLADSVRVCVIPDTDTDTDTTRTGFNSACGLLLSGTVTVDENGVPDENTITWNVTGGSVKKSGQDVSVLPAAVFSGASGSYTPGEPFFFLEFTVDDNDHSVDDGSAQVITRSNTPSRDYVRSPSDFTKGLLYLGRFVRYAITESGEATGTIVTEDTLCAPDPYEYSLGGEAELIHPFQIVDKSESSPAAAKISIRSGSANGTTPAAIDYEDIDDSTVYNLSNGRNNIFLKVTVGAELGLSVAEIEISDSFPPNTNTVGYDRIAAVYVVDDAVVAINQYVRANVSYVYGGDSIHLFFK